MTVPEAMSSRNQWVVWQYRKQSGEMKKVPVNEQGYAMKWKGTDNQLPYSEARARCDRMGDTADGIGYVFRADGPLCGIDLDGVVSEDGSVEPWAESVLEQLWSYTEVSPSGTGLHTIVRGTMPAGLGNKADGIEIYDRDRFFTVTGNHAIGTPEHVQERQEPLTEVCEQFLPEDTDMTDSSSTVELPESLRNKQGTAESEPDTPGEFINAEGINLGALMDEYDSLRSYLTEDVPSTIDGQTHVRPDGENPKPDWSRFDMKCAMSLAFHHFSTGQIRSILRRYRGPLRPDEKLGRTDYVRDTAEKAIQWTDNRANYGRTFQS
jgi:hypothetical protein